MNRDIDHTNMITCHLGNGASLTAIKDGKSINTSMGLAPLGGVMMGTRSGDIDPTVVFYMAKKLNATWDEMDTYLNKRSGMLGVSGISSDARDRPFFRVTTSTLCPLLYKPSAKYCTTIGTPLVSG